MKKKRLTDKGAGREETSLQALKSWFDALTKELHEIHKKWGKTHAKQGNPAHQAQHEALLAREAEVFNELDYVLTTAIAIMRSNPP
jgi:hypothetical protein